MAISGCVILAGYARLPDNHPPLTPSVPVQGCVSHAQRSVMTGMSLSPTSLAINQHGPVATVPGRRW